MKGDLKRNISKNGTRMTRDLIQIEVKSRKDNEFTLPGRSLMLVRNVGHLNDQSSSNRCKGNEDS